MGRLVRGAPGLPYPYNSASIDTPRIPVQHTYSVQITCATSWDPVTGAVTRETDTGAYTPT